MKNQIINNAQFDRKIKNKISEINRIFSEENKSRVRSGENEKYNKVHCCSGNVINT